MSQFEYDYSIYGKDVIIPEGVIEIQLRGFQGSKMKSVKLPSSIRTNWEGK